METPPVGISPVEMGLKKEVGPSFQERLALGDPGAIFQAADKVTTAAFFGDIIEGKGTAASDPINIARIRLLHGMMQNKLSGAEIIMKTPAGDPQVSLKTYATEIMKYMQSIEYLDLDAV